MSAGAQRLAILAGLLALGACNGELRFDEGTAGTSAAGAGAAAAGSGGIPNAAAGGTAGATLSNGCDHCSEHGLYCAAEWQACVECLTNDDCVGENPYCDAALHRCTPCNTLSGCAKGTVCDGWVHACMPSCATEADPDHDCENSGRTCDLDRSTCVQCRSDDDCDDTARAPHCVPGGDRCAECASDNDCAGTGRHCDPLSFACVACRDSRDCTLPLVCDPESHACVDTP